MPACGSVVLLSKLVSGKLLMKRGPGWVRVLPAKLTDNSAGSTSMGWRAATLLRVCCNRCCIVTRGGTAGRALRGLCAGLVCTAVGEASDAEGAVAASSFAPPSVDDALTFGSDDAGPDVTPPCCCKTAADAPSGFCNEPGAKCTSVAGAEAALLIPAGPEGPAMLGGPGSSCCGAVRLVLC